MITLFGLTFNIYAVLIAVAILIILYGIKKAQDDPESDFDWADLFTSVDQTTGERKASFSKILQIIGGITATFIVIKLTLQGSIAVEIFATYLAYVASVEGFSKFMLAKYGSQQNRDREDGYGGYGRGWRGGYDRYDRYDRQDRYAGSDRYPPRDDQPDHTRPDEYTEVTPETPLPKPPQD